MRLLPFFTSVRAQDVVPEKGVTATAMFGLSQCRSLHGTGKESSIGVVITPRIGYRLNPAWEAGGMFRYEKFGRNLNCYGIGAYGEYSFWRSDVGLRAFVDMQGYYSIPNSGNDGGNEDSFVEAGLTPGLAYHIANSPVDLKLRYLFVGFNNSERFYKTDAPGCLGRNDWILDASLRRLEIGLSVMF